MFWRFLLITAAAQTAHLPAGLAAASHCRRPGCRCPHLFLAKLPSSIARPAATGLTRHCARHLHWASLPPLLSARSSNGRSSNRQPQTLTLILALARYSNRQLAMYTQFCFTIGSTSKGSPSPSTFSRHVLEFLLIPPSLRQPTSPPRHDRGLVAASRRRRPGRCCLHTFPAQPVSSTARSRSHCPAPATSIGPTCLPLFPLGSVMAGAQIGNPEP